MIKFRTVRWKNFLSTGNTFTEIRLDKSYSTLIVGENGAGKSTILDAICFALFGKPFRNINKPQLVNSINSKNTLVELQFDVGRKSYVIRRGIKPAIFEIMCDDSLLNQDSASREYQKILEEQILKLNYKSFTQIVILGSASFTPFMQLPPSHRREIIEDILDIQIFTVMNTVLKDKISSIKDQLKNLENQIELGKQRARIQQEYIKKLEDDNQKRSAEAELRMTDLKGNIAGLQSTVTNLSNEFSSLNDSVADSDDMVDRKSEFNRLLKELMARIRKAQDEIVFYQEHDNCPTCAQSLPPDLKETTIHKHTHRIEEVETAIITLRDKIDAIDQRLEQISEIKSRMADIQSEIVLTNSEIIASQNFLNKIQQDTANDEDSLKVMTQEKAKLKDIAKEVVALNETRTGINEDRYYHEAAAALLKDTGIKTKIIRQYLPVINKLVNKYLAAMDFFVSFELDETFKEVIRSRHRDDFSYASFSEGEKQRIDLALLFTWRTIAKMKNSAATNLLILDEVFDSSLDNNGTDYVMNLINTLGEETNVFVISHKGDQLFDKFRSVIRFEKYQNYSQIKLS